MLFDVFQKYLDEIYPQYNVSIKEHLLPRMKDIVIDTILATKKSLNFYGRRHCFELLGYDFLIDEDFRTWLLEVNVNPNLGFLNKEHGKLMQHMISNILTLTLEPLVDNPLNNKGNDDEFEEIKFDRIYSDSENIN